MKDSVVVNGVTLTREQILQAHAELTAPPKPTPASMHGRVRRYGPLSGFAYYLLLDLKQVRETVDRADRIGRLSSRTGQMMIAVRLDDSTGDRGGTLVDVADVDAPLGTQKTLPADAIIQIKERL